MTSEQAHAIAVLTECKDDLYESHPERPGLIRAIELLRHEWEADSCRMCHGELADYSTPNDYVTVLDGVCGRCRVENESPHEQGRREQA